MRRFWREGVWKVGETVSLDKEESKHLKQVLRLEVGAAIALTNGQGLMGEGIIESMNEGVHVQISKTWSAPPGNEIILLLAVIKGPRLDWIVEKATELGVSEIHLAQTAYSLPLGDRLDRWHRIAKGAAKQSGSAHLPQIHPPEPLEELVRKFPSSASKILFSPTATSALDPKSLLGSPRVLAIGPEGGFSPTEEALLKENGFLSFCLHQNILRAETAALAAIAAANQLIAFSQSKRL